MEPKKEKTNKVLKSGPDMINHPPHYKQGRLEVIDIIEDQQLCYHAGNAVKYILRHRHKGQPVEDLKKAVWYLNRLIQKYEKVGKQK